MDKYGILLNDDIKLHRKYFEEMVQLWGIQCIYRAPKKDKHYTTYAEIEANYQEPQQVGVIFTDHPDQKTLKKIGWVSELQEDASLIHVPYDTPKLRDGGVFEVPSGLDNTPGKKFVIKKMRTSMVYPSEVVCHIAPLFTSISQKSQLDYSKQNFTLLNHADKEEDDD